MPDTPEEFVPLAPRTTLGIGGSARYLANFRSDRELSAALNFAHEQDLPVFLLGGGSNVVISDSGFPGLVLCPLHHEIQMEASGNRVLLTVGAGEEWEKVVQFAVTHRLAGIECLAGIPGLTGGTPVQNVGAYGQEVADTIVSVCAYDRQTGNTVDLPHSECGFAYRRSRFNHGEAGRWIILSVTFALIPEGAPTVKYADLQNYFGPNTTPDLIGVYQAVRTIRARKGMVLDATDSDTRSAGSFFKNPALTKTAFASLCQQASARGIENIPNFPQPDGTVKIPAAFLMEKAGLKRGQGFGNGRIALSSKHVLALTNRGDATAAEVVAAACEVQSQVIEAWDILLAPEPIFVGFSPDSRLPLSVNIA